MKTNTTQYLQYIIIVILGINSAAGFIGVMSTMRNTSPSCFYVMEKTITLAEHSAPVLLFLSLILIFIQQKMIISEKMVSNSQILIIGMIPIFSVISITSWYMLSYASPFRFEVIFASLVVSTLRYLYVLLKYRTITEIKTLYIVVVGCIWFYIRMVDYNTSDLNLYATPIIGYQLSLLSCWTIVVLSDIVDHEESWLERGLRIFVMMVIVTNPLPWFTMAVIRNQCVP